MDHLGVFHLESACIQEPEVSLGTLWGFTPCAVVLMLSGWHVRGLKFALEHCGVSVVCGLWCACTGRKGKQRRKGDMIVYHTGRKSTTWLDV